MGRWRSAVGLAAFLSLGAQAALNLTPPLPYEDPGACPFECCTYREWSVEADTAVRSDREDAAPIAFSVRRGQKVTGVTGVVTTTKLGQAVVKRPTVVGERKLRVEAGEAVYILHYVGEGYWKFWLRGQVDQDQLPDKRDECVGGPCAVQVVEEPVTVWWAKVRDAQGREGWTRQLDHFGEIDACG
jgi:hypothetical protein